VSDGDNGFERWRIALALAILAIALLALGGCGDNGVEDSPGGGEVPVAKAEGKATGELTISNWALYIDRKTVPEFEEETGVSVNYVEDINSYDEFFGKLQPQLDRGESGGRSLMVAGDWLAKQMYDLGYIQRLDKEALAPALENLSPEIKAPSSDPDWDFSFPWQGGMTGLIVNTKLAPDIDSIEDIFDPEYKGKIEVVSELRETPALVMKASGVDPEEATTQDWLDAIERLAEAGRSGQIRRFTGGDYARDLAAGDAVAVIGWAADAIQLQADNPDLEWVMPKEGCLIWWDNWVIPAGAPNPTAAYEWINYTYDPANQAQIVGWTSAITPVAGVKEILEKTNPEAAKSELIFPTKEYTKNCSSVVSPPGDEAAQQEVEAAWSDALAG
jgi:spermidine/putrescine transport system substrate-binding protein